MSFRLTIIPHCHLLPTTSRPSSTEIRRKQSGSLQTAESTRPNTQPPPALLSVGASDTALKFLVKRKPHSFALSNEWGSCQLCQINPWHVTSSQ